MAALKATVSLILAPSCTVGSALISHSVIISFTPVEAKASMLFSNSSMLG